MQDHLEAGQRVVAQRPVAEDAVAQLQRIGDDVIVEDDGAGRLHITFDTRAFQKDHLGVVVRIGAHLELATLENRKIKLKTEFIFLARKFEKDIYVPACPAGRRRISLDR